MRYLLFTVLLLVPVVSAYSQGIVMPPNDTIDFSDFGAGEDPENLTLVLPFGDLFDEGPPLEDVIEGVGRPAYPGVPVYSKADRGSKVIRYTSGSDERVIITAKNDNWYCVRMYNGKEGFIERRNLKTMRIFYDESTSSGSMDKRIGVELRDLVSKFNTVLAESMYAERYQIVPRFTVISSAKRKNEITLTLEYFAVDSYGSVIPSRQDNMLQKELQGFMELLFLKMLPANATSYKIVIRKPVFSENGRVLNTQGAYAEITLQHDDVDIKKIRESSATILSVAKTNIPKDKLFLDYPN